MSRPRRPRLRFMESAESATSCSSLSTNCGIDEGAVEEAGLADVGDPPVDDHARVEDAIPLQGTRVPEQAHQPSGLEPFTLARPHQDSEVWEHQENEAVEKHDAAIARVGPEQRRTDRLREPEADCAADQRAEQIRDFGVPQACLDPTIRTPRPAPTRRLTSALELKGPARTAAYVTAATKRARARRNHAMYECLANRPRGRCPRRIKRSDHEHHTRDRRASREARRTYSSASTESGSLAITHGIEEANNYQQIR